MRIETGVRAKTGTEAAVGIEAGLSAAADPLTPRPQAARYPNPRSGGLTTMPGPLTSSAMAGSSGQSKDCLLDCLSRSPIFPRRARIALDHHNAGA